MESALNRVYSISFNSTNFGEFFQRTGSKFRKRKRKSLSWALSLNQEIPEIRVAMLMDTRFPGVPGNKWNFGKVALFSCWNFPVEMHVPFTNDNQL